MPVGESSVQATEKESVAPASRWLERVSSLKKRKRQIIPTPTEQQDPKYVGKSTKLSASAKRYSKMPPGEA